MLNHNKLKGDEILELKKLIHKYLYRDKLDILIEMTLRKLGVSKQEFNSRNKKINF